MKNYLKIYSYFVLLSVCCVFSQTTSSQTFQQNFQTLRVDVMGPTFMQVNMTLVDHNTWQTVITIPTDLYDPAVGQDVVFVADASIQDPYGGLPYGDFENDGIAEIYAPPVRRNLAPGHYVVTFNDQTLVYSIERQFIESLPYNRNFYNLRVDVMGSTHMEVNMILVDHHTWQVVLTIPNYPYDPAFGQDVVFIAGTSPQDPYGGLPLGDFENDGIAESHAPPARQNLTPDNYVVTFNDQTLVYSIERQITEPPYNYSFHNLRVDVISSVVAIEVNMTLVDDHTWQAVVTIPDYSYDPDFGQEVYFMADASIQDPYGGLSFGDIENDGIADMYAPPSRQILTPDNYVVTFNDQTLVYSIERQAVEPPYHHNFNNLRVDVMGPAAAMEVDMALVDHHTWQAVLTIPVYPYDSTFRQDIYFMADASPQDPYGGLPLGDFENDGIAESHAPPVRQNLTPDNYVVTFNDQTLVYSIERQVIEPLPYNRNFNNLGVDVMGPAVAMEVSMALVDHHIWQAEVTIPTYPYDPAFGQDMYFIADLNPLDPYSGVPYGDDENDGIAEIFGPPSRHNLTPGNYVVTFNDETLVYSIERKITEPPYKHNFDNLRVDVMSLAMGVNMALVGDHTWQAVITIPTHPYPSFGQEIYFMADASPQDPYSGFRFGDIENDGIAESDAPPTLRALAPGSYVVTFNDQTLVYSIERPATQPPYNRNFDNLRVDVMSPAVAMEVDMMLVDHHTWQAVVTIPSYPYDPAFGQDVVFMADASPQKPYGGLPFGDFENDGKAELDAPPSRQNLVTGNYVLTFNDQTLVYSIRRQAIEPLPYNRHFANLRVDVMGPAAAMEVNMALVGDHTWQAVVTITTELYDPVFGQDVAFMADASPQDPYGGLWFGDFENDGIADVYAQPSRQNLTPDSYVVTFNDQTLVYSIETQDSHPLPYQRNYENLLVDVWGPAELRVNMKLVDHYTWQAVVTIPTHPYDPVLGQEMVFVADPNPQDPFIGASFGDFENDGIAEMYAPPSRQNLTPGNYVVTFNDRTLMYSIERQFSEPLSYNHSFTSLRIDVMSPAVAMEVDMALVDHHTWRAVLTVPTYPYDPAISKDVIFMADASSQDPYSGLPFGDNENDGIAEVHAPPSRQYLVPGNYVLTFNDQTAVYSIERQFTESLPYNRNFDNLGIELIGPAQMRVNMALVDHNTWQAVITISIYSYDPTYGQEILFIADSSPQDPYFGLWVGDYENDGIAEIEGPPFNRDLPPGNYKVTFNDQTLAYSLQPQL